MAYPYQSYQGGMYQQYYQPMYQPMQQNQQIQNSAQAQQISPVANQNGIIWISGESEAAMYPIAPNNAVALWDRNGKVIYLKSADATGKPTMAIYDLVKRETAEPESEPAHSYATKADLGEVVGAMKDVTGIIDSLKSDVDAIKGEVYGLAGRKKTAKKTVEVDTDE